VAMRIDGGGDGYGKIGGGDGNSASKVNELPSVWRRRRPGGGGVQPLIGIVGGLPPPGTPPGGGGGGGGPCVPSHQGLADIECLPSQLVGAGTETVELEQTSVPLWVTDGRSSKKARLCMYV